MRIWSLHPRYLDSKGLIALWREALLAKHVLMGKTNGYKNHPQLLRFVGQDNPVNLIDQYLVTVYDVALQKGYNFNKWKIDWDFKASELKVTRGQIEFERRHLLKKLKIRDRNKYAELIQQKEVLPHPLFRIVEGEIEIWEKTKRNDK
jgi:hypothetical protein